MAQDDTTPSNGVANLTDFQRDVLFVLAGLGAVPGTRIKEAVSTYRDTEINHGRMYPNLDTLADRGLLNKDTDDGRANIYELSELGAAALQERTKWERERLEEVDA